MLTRSSLLSLLLVVAIGLVVTKTYWLWMSGPWDLPNPRKPKSPIAAEDNKAITNPRTAIGTETIISKNIFDPERGAGFDPGSRGQFPGLSANTRHGSVRHCHTRQQSICDFAGRRFPRSGGGCWPIARADAHQTRGYG